jgi:hypothetical protein
MKIISGKQASNWGEAQGLAVRAAGFEDLSADAVDMFESIAGNSRLNDEADKTIGAAVKQRYGNKATWRSERYFIPVPRLRYDGKGNPQLIFEVTVYLVAAAVVKTHDDSRIVTVIGAIGKQETINLPMVFLHAILENDLDPFAIAARDATHTTWDIPGAGPVRLPNDFLNEIQEVLKFQSVVSWLANFGVQGRSVAPLVAGNLLGLAYRDKLKRPVSSSEIMTTESLLSALENMAFHRAEAKEMVDRAMPYLRYELTLEEAIRITLQDNKEEPNHGN